MRALLLSLCLLAACSPVANDPDASSAAPDAGVDAGPIDTIDAGVDAGVTPDCATPCGLATAICPSVSAMTCLASCDAARAACLQAAGFDCLAFAACTHGSPERAFSGGPFGTGVKDLAGPVSLPTSAGTLDLARWWTGRQSLVFLFRSNVTDDLFRGNLDALLDASPDTVTYVFGWQTDQAAYTVAKGRWLAQLARRADRAKWAERVLFVDTDIAQTDGWIAQMMKDRVAHPPTYLGNGLSAFAIDRTQRIREVGMLGRLTGSGVAADLTMLAHEVEAFDREVALEQRLGAQRATVVTLATAQTAHDTIDVDVTLPDPSAFDTLEADLAIDCPNHRNAECGAWDYLSHLRLCSSSPSADGGTAWSCDRELARWITTYWREGRWVTDISAQLAVLPAGPVHLRWTANGQWDPRTTDYIVSLSLRYSNQGRGMRPVQAVPLWTGGDWNATYDATKQPITVAIPADAKKVELVTLTTGHGGVAGTNCSEFCGHEHHFTVGTTEHLQAFPEVQTIDGCEKKVGQGVVPNQHGTWYYGRGGWCPGQDVAPWVVDVTGDVTPGQSATLRYRTTLDGHAVAGDQGNIVLSSWLVIWK